MLYWKNNREEDGNKEEDRNREEDGNVKLAHSKLIEAVVAVVVVVTVVSAGTQAAEDKTEGE